MRTLRALCLTLGTAALLLAAAGPGGSLDAHATGITGMRFNDADLAAAISPDVAGHPRRGLLYTWSPHMPYSVRGLEELLGLGQRLGLTVVALLDPDADPRLAARVIKTAGLPEHSLRVMRSNRLFDRGVTLHYPTLLVFSAGRLADSMLPGYVPPRVCEAFVRSHLGLVGD